MLSMALSWQARERTTHLWLGWKRGLPHERHLGPVQRFHAEEPQHDFEIQHSYFARQVWYKRDGPATITRDRACGRPRVRVVGLGEGQREREMNRHAKEV
jgi:hypothetical protein